MYTSARSVMSSITNQSDLLVEIKGEQKAKLMEVLLEIMQDIHTMCVKNNIGYSMVGGTLLGAVRHKGFIPWDDDFDISMLREDFEKFKECFEKDLGDKYILEAPNYKNIESKTVFGKVHKKGTQLWEVQDVSVPFAKGIYIDIFIYDNVSANKLVRKIDGLISDFMKGVATSMVYYKYPSEIMTQYYGATSASKSYLKKRRFLGFLFSFIPHKTWVNWFDKFVSRHKKDTGIITAPTGRKYYNGEIIKKSWWKPFQLMPFEDKEFCAMNEPHKYLANLYGNDYMQLPPVDKRERHFCVKLDFGE